MSTLNLEQAAALLHVHENTVMELAGNGEIPAAKIGRAWVFIETDVVDWLRTKTLSQTAERRRLVTVEEDRGKRPTRRRHRRDLPDLGAA